MENIGREPAKDNDLFFTCSLIDYIARKTKNTRAEIVNKLGKKNLDKIYDLADVYHCDYIDRVSDDFISDAEIKKGTFDNVAECKYSIPSHWDIGKVYKRLIKSVAEEKKMEMAEFMENAKAAGLTFVPAAGEAQAEEAMEKTAEEA